MSSPSDPTNQPDDPIIAAIEALRASIESMRDELAGRDERWIAAIVNLAPGPVPDAAGGSPTESSSDAQDDWQSRRERILEQMERDEFDPETFLHSLTDRDAGEPPEASESAGDMDEKLRRSERVCQQQARELEDLREALAYREHQQGEHGAAVDGDAGATGATGAHAIAALLMDDEVIAAERARTEEVREKLQQQLRQAEVAASLQRAELARRDSELRCRETELAEKFDDLHRRLASIQSPPDLTPDARQGRWLPKLRPGRRGP